MKAATRAKNKYNANNYDRIFLYVPKGEKAEIDRKAKEKGFKSLNEFVNNAIQKALED